MKADHLFSRAILLCLLFVTSLASSAADTINVAVASNFASTLRILSLRFTEQTGHRIRVSTGSTGKLYAQIVNGAPFDVMLAADQARPKLLEAASHAVAGSRFSYAEGRLMLWSADPQLASQDCLAALRQDGQARVAIANPLTAPYGAAARESLRGLKLWAELEPRIVRGENIAQALHFAASGNARFGLVSVSQLRNASLPATGCVWQLPSSLHSSIEQQAVLLQRAADNALAIEFLRFLRSDDAKQIIAEHGYSIPGPALP